jgi:hypothetical protein
MSLTGVTGREEGTLSPLRGPPLPYSARAAVPYRVANLLERENAPLPLPSSFAERARARIQVTF